MIPPLIPGADPGADPNPTSAADIIQQLNTDVMKAQDNSLEAKIQQAHFTNQSHKPEHVYEIGDRVLLSTINRRWEYTQVKDGQVAKFMPRYDGPYTVIDVHPETSNYTLDLPNTPNIFPTFHSSYLIPAKPNDWNLLLSREYNKPTLIITPDGEEEYFVERILDERRRGCGKQYLAWWHGYGPEHNLWLPSWEVSSTQALDIWPEKHSEPWFNFSWRGEV